MGKCTSQSRMNILRKLFDEEHGQGLVEYTLIVLLVALVLWVSMKDTAVGDALATNLSKVTDCLSAPFSCSSGS
jgi:Flp pilus assembly pilin Flp